MSQLFNYSDVGTTAQAEAGLESNRAYRMRSSDASGAANEAKSARMMGERENAAPAAQGPSDTPTSGKMTSPAGAGVVEGTAAQAKPDQQAPAIGLFRLPVDQTADALLDRLQLSRSLTRLAPFAETDGTKQLQESSGTGQSLAYGAAGGAAGGAAVSGDPGKPSDLRTVVLFVTASEAQEILQSLSSDRKQLALGDKEAAQETQGNGQAAQVQPQDRAADALAAEPAPGGAAEQPLAGWWTRPQIFFRQGADKAPTAGDEKVVLILSEVPN